MLAIACATIYRVYPVYLRGACSNFKRSLNAQALRNIRRVARVDWVDRSTHGSAMGVTLRLAQLRTGDAVVTGRGRNGWHQRVFDRKPILLGPASDALAST